MKGEDLWFQIVALRPVLGSGLSDLTYITWLPSLELQRTMWVKPLMNSSWHSHAHMC